MSPNLDAAAVVAADHSFAVAAEPQASDPIGVTGQNAAFGLHIDFDTGLLERVVFASPFGEPLTNFDVEHRFFTAVGGGRGIPRRGSCDRDWKRPTFCRRAVSASG